MPIHRRALRYTPADWKWFDRQRIDPMDGGQVRMVAGILQTSEARVQQAIREAGTKGGAIRKWLADHPASRGR